MTAPDAAFRPWWHDPTAQAPAPIDPDTAAAIRATVWPAWIQALDADFTGGLPVLRGCACEKGVCGPCRWDRPMHDLCDNRSSGPDGWPMALWSRAGVRIAAVRLADRSCLWECPCPCRSEHAHEPAEVGQLTLFAEVG